MEETTLLQHRPFLKGGGEMGALIRAMDWGKTPLGGPDTWPQSLRTTLQTVLHSRFPMFVFWGSEFTCFYNDAYRPSLGHSGKHPALLGQSAKEGWADIWHIVGPLLDQVMSGGEAIWREDQLIPINRNGRVEDVYWTFTYSPVDDGLGGVGGVLVVCAETTEKVRALQALRESETRSRTLFEQAPVAIAIVKGRDFVVDLANEAMARLWRRPVDEVLGRPLFNVVTEGRGQGYEEVMLRVMDTGEPFHATDSAADLMRDGVLERGYFNIAHYPFREADGAITGLMMVASETTGQIRDRKNARESEWRLRGLISESLVATNVFIGREMKIEMANETVLKYWGKDASAIGKTLREAVPELDGQPFHQILDGVFTTGISHNGKEEYAELQVDGKLRGFYFNYRYKALRTADGEIYGVLNMATDVTGQVLARKKLEESEHRLNMALGSAQMGTWDFDLATGTTVYSERTCELFGFRPGETITHEVAAAVIADEDRDRVLAAIGQAMQPGSDGVYDIEYSTISRHDGHRRAIRVKGKVFFDKNRQPVRFLGTALDITEETKVRQAIKEKNEELNKIVQEFTFVTDFMPQIVWATRADGYHDFYNQQWYSYTGLTYEQTKDTGWNQVLHPDDQERAWKIWRHSLATGEPYEIEYRLCGGGGRYRWFLARALPMYNDQGEIAKWFGTCTDITDRKEQTEELELRVAERTQALAEANCRLQRSNSDLEQFAYVASHDLQEPLRKITTVGSRLEKKYAETLGDDGKMLLGIMTNATERMKLLIESLLTFSRMARKVETREQVNLNRIMENIISDYELKIMETASRIEYDPLPVLEGVPQQMHQLFQNLLSNSLKFAEPNVPPLIQMRSEIIDAQEQEDLKLNRNRTYYKITFEDNGIGFEEEYAEKIFTIFQRLHGAAQYQGAGIGLSICRQVVENHGGTITAQGRLGTGSLFTIILPGQQTQNSIF